MIPPTNLISNLMTSRMKMMRRIQPNAMD